MGCGSSHSVDQRQAGRRSVYKEGFSHPSTCSSVIADTSASRSQPDGEERQEKQPEVLDKSAAACTEQDEFQCWAYPLSNLALSDRPANQNTIKTTVAPPTQVSPSALSGKRKKSFLAGDSKCLLDFRADEDVG